MKKNKDSQTLQLLVKRRNAGYLVISIEQKK
jgi:hypothetical protein